MKIANFLKGWLVTAVARSKGTEKNFLNHHFPSFALVNQMFEYYWGWSKNMLVVCYARCCLSSFTCTFLAAALLLVAERAEAQNFSSDKRLFDELVRDENSSQRGIRISRRCEIVHWRTNLSGTQTLYTAVDLESDSTSIGVTKNIIFKRDQLKVSFAPSDHAVTIQYWFDLPSYQSAFDMSFDDFRSSDVFASGSYSCNSKKKYCTISYTGDERIDIFGKVGDRTGPSVFHGRVLFLFRHHDGREDSNQRTRTMYEILQRRIAACR